MASWTSLSFELKSRILFFSITNALDHITTADYLALCPIGVVEPGLDNTHQAITTLLTTFPSMSTETRLHCSTLAHPRFDLAAQWTLEREYLLRPRPNGESCGCSFPMALKRKWRARAESTQRTYNEWLVLDVCGRMARPGWTDDGDAHDRKSSLVPPCYMRKDFASKEQFRVLSARYWMGGAGEMAQEMRLGDLDEVLRQRENEDSDEEDEDEDEDEEDEDEDEEDEEVDKSESEDEDNRDVLTEQNHNH